MIDECVLPVEELSHDPEISGGLTASPRHASAGCGTGGVFAKSDR
jgi:hypothetical protein